MHLKVLQFLFVLAIAGCGGGGQDAAQAPGDTTTLSSRPTDVAQPQEAASPSEASDVDGDVAALELPSEEQPEIDEDSSAAKPMMVAAADTPGAPASTRFQMGKEYQRLTPTQPTSSSPEQVEVAEIFWYGCSHCYNFDPYVEKWLTRKPENVNFVRIPAVWNPLVKFHARAFYAAQALDKEDEMHTSFFREIHLNGNSLESEEKLIEFFGRFGVSSDDFASAFNSFAVHTKLQQAETLARRYRVTSVPLVVVNGKYTTSASMTGDYDTLMEVIDELVMVEGNAT